MLLKSISFLPASIKSMNPMQKYPHITELFACTRKILAIMFLFPTNSLISSGTCSTPKLSKFLLHNKAIQYVPTFAYLSRFITYTPYFIFNGRLFLEKTPLILVHFDNALVFQSLLKDETALKIPLLSSVSSYNSFSFFISRTSSYNSFSCY